MEELAELTTRLDKTSCKYGMEISAEKSKVLSMGVDSRERTDIIVGGVTLETAKFQIFRSKDNSGWSLRGGNQITTGHCNRCVGQVMSHMAE